MVIKTNALILVTLFSTFYVVKSCDAGVCAGVTAACAVTCGKFSLFFFFCRCLFIHNLFIILFDLKSI